ncbi:unnamed protein product [Plutella xylostella]|uniref:(diamondback moth) hypothetical protein n=1 Tax=Plutella xylostella TaxID=51655 RepID=A0A8S4FYN5_PLUXY|nr:putative transmembrane protein INAFM2 isoform X2 [Plutella xylostella]CAG9132884.1 unnamed protein product [Plutella xylostella]
MSWRSGGSVRSLPAPATHHVLDSLYERKGDNKSVRVLTVLVYVFCVSLAAIMLSLYYVFFWEPKDAPYAQRKVAHTVEKQTSTTPLPTCLMPYTGGSNISMNDSASLEPFENATSTEDAPSEEPPSIDPALASGEDYDANHTSLAPPDTPGQAT